MGSTDAAPRQVWVNVIDSFPRRHLQCVVVMGASAFGVGLLDAFSSLDLAPFDLPHCGCLMTLSAAMGEWRIIQWQCQVAGILRDANEHGAIERQASSVHAVQVDNSAWWVHLLFLLGTIAWGFGDQV